MATIYEAHGSFHLRLYSNVDVSTGALLPAGENGKVLRKQQSVRLCRKDDALYRLKSSPAVQRLAADKQEQIQCWEEAHANGDAIVTDPSITVAEFYRKEFIPTLERLIAAGKKSHSTLTSCQRYWKTYLKDHFNSTKTLRGYTPSIGARFLQSLRKDDGTNFGENTINHIHSAASSIFTLAVELEYIDHNPWHDIKKRNVASVDPEEGAAYSELEVETLIENLGLETTARNRRSIEMAQLVLAIGIWAGLRPSEIAALRYEDIDIDKGTILVRRGHVYGKTKESTKTGKERVVYYLSPLAGRLRLWSSENQKISIHGWLFENHDGNPIHLNSLSRRIIAPIAKKYGTLHWENNAFYGARRGFGTLLVLSGASCEEVAKQMGNTRDVVWKFYFKDRDSELAQSAAAKYEARKRLR
jgi:integrase